MPLRRLLVPALWVLALTSVLAIFVLVAHLPTANTLTPHLMIGLLAALVACLAPLIDRLESCDAD